MGRSTEALIEDFRSTFPDGDIEFLGMKQPNNTSPGPFFRIDTGKRVMRHPVRDVIRGRGLAALIARERKDVELDSAWRQDARENGAEILGYEHDGKRLEIRYRNRGGLDRCDTIWRAREVCWGQTGYKKGEKLCLAIMELLFPLARWQTNARPDFLSSDKNGTRQRLELDLFCRELSIGLEHQGRQHKSFPNAFDRDKKTYLNRIARDAQKAERCAQTGVRLLVIDQEGLDPSLYLRSILDALERAGLSTAETPSEQQIRDRWQQHCRSPLARFQERVQKRLDQHQHLLIEPQLEYVTPGALLTYRCGQCSTLNQVDAKAFSEAPNSGHCDTCKGDAIGSTRRAQSLERWRAQLPPKVFSALEYAPGTRIHHRCERGHVQRLSSLADALSHIRDGEFLCNECLCSELSVSSNEKQSAIALAALRPQFEQSIANAGFDLARTEFRIVTGTSDGRNQWVATLSCPAGHRFERTMMGLRTALLNKYLGDRTVVPHVCPECAYPNGVPDACKSTVHHRLSILRAVHARVSYTSGFDATGRKPEKYWCGEHFNDGTPHPPFSVLPGKLTARGESLTARCYVCGTAQGVIPRGTRTLADVEGRMKLIAEALAALTGAHATKPKVLLGEGVERIPHDEVIETTRTRLVFHCGHQGHRSVTSNVDRYFNCARGPGYCPTCIRDAQLTNANELFRTPLAEPESRTNNDRARQEIGE